MSTYSLSHLTDHVLLRDLAALVARDRATTAALLAHLAEVDARRLYVPAGFPSMYAYCVQELRLSEQSAFKRIRVARTARRFPAILDAVAQGELSLSTVVLLAPYLTAENGDELLAAATHKTKFEIEQLIVGRFRRQDVPVLVEAIAEPPSQETLPTNERAQALVDGSPSTVEESTGPAEQLSPGTVASAPRPRVAPLAPQRFALQLTMGQEMHDDLRYAQELLSHQVPSGDVTEVLHRALKALIGQLEKRKFAATRQPRPRQGHLPARGRYIPAEIKRTVWERDGGQCTFVSVTGRRCSARTLLEFDHIDEVARGGRATVERMRLRCRAHNQFSAEQAFGTEFMEHKRQESRRAAAVAKARAQAAAEHVQEVIPWLRSLGFRADQARHAAALCEDLPNAPLEERVRVVLSYFAPRRGKRSLGSAA